MRITVRFGDWKIIREFCMFNFGMIGFSFAAVDSSSKRTLFCCSLLVFLLFVEEQALDFGTVPVEM